MNIYYVYAFLREDGSPYYIGKGKEERAYDPNHSVPIPKDKTKIIFLEKNLTNIGALALERRYIKWYGRKDLGTGILRNHTDGGEGTAGLVQTVEHRAKIGNANRNRVLSEESRGNISKGKIGKKLSVSHVENISKALIGKNTATINLEQRPIKIEELHEDLERRSQ